MLELLVVVTSKKSDAILLPFLEALQRKQSKAGVFLTNSGAQVLNNADLAALLSGWDDVVVCGESWQKWEGKKSCPVALGSQTDHSRLIGQASKVICL